MEMCWGYAAFLQNADKGWWDTRVFTPGWYAVAPLGRKPVPCALWRLPVLGSRWFVFLSILCYESRAMNSAKNTYERLLILTDLGMVRVLNFKEAGDDPQDRAHLVELSKEELESPIGASTTDGPGKFNRGFAAGEGEAMSHAETKLDVEVEKRAIALVAKEISGVVTKLGCNSFMLAAPQEHLKRLVADLDAKSREKLVDSVGADLTKTSLKDLEKRFL